MSDRKIDVELETAWKEWDLRPGQEYAARRYTDLLVEVAEMADIPYTQLRRWMSAQRKAGKSRKQIVTLIVSDL